MSFIKNTVQDLCSPYKPAKLAKHRKRNIYTLKREISVEKRALNQREIRRENVPQPSIFFPA
ncbi:hypothetical protein DUD43_03235 [Alcaligenes faecalis]|nr:hypothetical protein DUD43_03235 [Alcaligenes faecalis]